MNILVFAENTDGNFKKSTFEAVSYAAQIAKQNNGTCTAVSVGNIADEKLTELGKYGATKVLSYKQELLGKFAAETYSKVISHAAQNDNAELVIISNTYSGKSIAPRIAARLKAGIVTGVISIPQTETGFKVRRTVFSGKSFADIEMFTPVKVIAITPNSFAVEEMPQTCIITQLDAGLTNSDQVTRSVEITRNSGKIVLTEAEVVISAGRGMKGPENWHMIEELADILGAATACSKPVSDMDWRPHTEHVGQTGITIKPNLYMAIGISGAIQHLAGVSSSKVIVVINKDAEAPFFKAADYGIVGDAFEVLPKLIEAAKAFKRG
ncbi:MAG: electron transfer flavoprotein subunit alpha/FixB family protein [Bacteroidia bacterium]|nr:electron transfer flavoprotein subunit alpha/FixB family protein [Bacteroidia bacterium]